MITIISQRLSKDCPPNAKFYDLNAINHDIVKDHNAKRDKVAGEFHWFLPAERMGEMQWNYELAQMAALNVKTCKLGEDGCRNTKEYKFAGQSVGGWYWNGKDTALKDTVLNIINMWFGQYANATMADVEKFQNDTPLKKNFLTIVTEHNIKVGCAAINLPQGKTNFLILCCNYATDIYIDDKIYNPGPATSKCASGSKNQNYKNLCSIYEKYDPNKSLP